MSSQVLVVGNIRESERETIALAATRCDASLVFLQSAQRALAKLRSGGERPICVLADGDVDIRHLVDGIRDEAELFSTSVLVMLNRASNDLYRAAYIAGADDVLPINDAGGLTRRLANLSHKDLQSRPAATLGVAVVLSKDEVSRRRLGRTLRQVGFDVDYASTVEDVSSMVAAGRAPKFAVTTEARRVSPSSGQLRSVDTIDGVPMLCLAPTAQDEMISMGDHIVDVTARLLFFADEQAKAQFKDRRASARKLYSNICSFREAGSLQPNYGVTYNISREGLYIRTLDPPRAQSTVWLELRAPRSETPIHVRAKAVWQRLPGSGPGIMPPGFGLRIDTEDCPPKDLRAYNEGYASLTE